MGSDFVAVMCEELEKLWYQNIEGSVEYIAVQHFRRVLAYLLERTEGSLTRAVVIGVQHLDQSGQQFRPIHEFAFGRDGRYKDAYCGPD
jgi:hypothetical protein